MFSDLWFSQPSASRVFWYVTPCSLYIEIKIVNEGGRVNYTLKIEAETWSEITTLHCVKRKKTNRNVFICL